jgi:hypothetical protein
MRSSIRLSLNGPLWQKAYQLPEFSRICRNRSAAFDHPDQQKEIEMPKYLLSYHGGEFPSELEAVVGPLWKQWMDNIGDRAVDRGGPLQPSRTIGAGGAVTDTGWAGTTGYSIITADSLEAAIAFAQRCPQISPPHQNGTVEVAELIEM